MFCESSVPEDQTLPHNIYVPVCVAIVSARGCAYARARACAYVCVMRMRLRMSMYMFMHAWMRKFSRDPGAQTKGPWFQP